MFPQYVVVNNVTHTSHNFEKSQQVAIFLWGRNHKNYSVFKTRRVNISGEPINVIRFQQVLEDA